MQISKLSLEYKGAFPTFDNQISASIKHLSLNNADWKLEQIKDDYSTNIKTLINLETLVTRFEYNFDFSSFIHLKEIKL